MRRTVAIAAGLLVASALSACGTLNDTTVTVVDFNAAAEREGNLSLQRSASDQPTTAAVQVIGR